MIARIPGIITKSQCNQHLIPLLKISHHSPSVKHRQIKEKVPKKNQKKVKSHQVAHLIQKIKLLIVIVYKIHSNESP